MIFKGPKGVGKSAILRMIECRQSADKQRLIRVSPDDLAFTSLANSQPNTPLLRSAVNNQWLFKSLWNYILLVNILQREPRVAGSSLLDRVLKVFKREDARLAEQLLKKSFRDDGNESAGFTETMLQLIAEIEIGIQTPGIGGSVAMSTRAPTQSTRQVEVLSLIDRVAKTLPTIIEHDYYILIDDLDSHWTNDPVQNAVIAALFSSMAKLNRTRHIKFVVAIRDDIYRYLPIEDKDKSRDWVCDVGWDKHSLKEKIECRMQVLHNINHTQLWDALLPAGALDRMLVHGHHRPRELLRQVQLAMIVACDAGHEIVGNNDLTEGLRRASVEKLEELEQEISHKYPAIRWIVQHFVGGKREFDLSLLKDVAETIHLELDEGATGSAPSEAKWVSGMHERPRELAYMLVDAGFLLIKTSRSAVPQELPERAMFEQLQTPWFAIRPMYCPGLLIAGT